MTDGQYILKALEEGTTNLECLYERMQELGWCSPAPFYRVYLKCVLNRLAKEGLVAFDFDANESDPLIWRNN